MTARYRDAVALRRALEDRLKQQSADRGHDLARSRRIVIFDRLAARLACDPDGEWVLKGGAALEFRFQERARTTKDLDLATRSGVLEGTEVREHLIEAVAVNLDSDGFQFQVAAPQPLTPDASGRAAWRFAAQVALAGKPFGGIRVDVAARGEEISGTEMLALPNVLAFAGAQARSIEAVDRRQHFAEKLHALTRDYGDRPNTRVKDLVDLVLLIESSLAPDTALLESVQHVFRVRGTHPVPALIEARPTPWCEAYPAIAQGLTQAAPELQVAMELLQTFWTKTLTHDETER